MALTQEEIQKIRGEEGARQNIRKELNTPKPGQKSVTAVLIWTVLFGCFGLFYVSGTVGLIASVLGVLLALGSGGLLGPVVWIVSIITGVVMVQDMNKNKS